MNTIVNCFTGTENLELLREMLSRKQLTICVWEAKQAMKLLMQCCRLRCETKLSDPTVAEWLLKPHGNTPTLKQLVSDTLTISYRIIVTSINKFLGIIIGQNLNFHSHLEYLKNKEIAQWQSCNKAYF